MTIFNIFECRFLNFYKADLKSEARFVLRKVRAFHRYLVCLSFDILSIVLSIHFNYPRPYIEIATDLINLCTMYVLVHVRMYLHWKTITQNDHKINVNFEPYMYVRTFCQLLVASYLSHSKTQVPQETKLSLNKT